MITKWVKVSSGVWKPSTKTEWWILSLQYIIIFHYFFNEGLCKLNKWWKMTEKMTRACSTLSFSKWWKTIKWCLLGRKNLFDRMCWNMNQMSEWKQLTLYWYLCILEGKKHELTFSNFLTIKKLELDFTNLFNHDKNNTEFFLETWEGKRCL